MSPVISSPVPHHPHSLPPPPKLGSTVLYWSWTDKRSVSGVRVNLTSVDLSIWAGAFTSATTSSAFRLAEEEEVARPRTAVSTETQRQIYGGFNCGGENNRQTEIMQKISFLQIFSCFLEIFTLRKQKPWWVADRRPHSQQLNRICHWMFQNKRFPVGPFSALSQWDFSKGCSDFDASWDPRRPETPNTAAGNVKSSKDDSWGRAFHFYCCQCFSSGFIMGSSKEPFQNKTPV